MIPISNCFIAMTFDVEVQNPNRSLSECAPCSLQTIMCSLTARPRTCPDPRAAGLLDPGDDGVAVAVAVALTRRRQGGGPDAGRDRP